MKARDERGYALVVRPCRDLVRGLMTVGEEEVRFGRRLPDLGP